MGGVWYSGGNWAGTLMTRWYDVSSKPPTWIMHNTVVANGPRNRGIWLEYASATNTVLINNIASQYSTNGGGEISTFDNSTGSNLRVDSIRNNLFYALTRQRTPGSFFPVEKGTKTLFAALRSAYRYYCRELLKLGRKNHRPQTVAALFRHP